MHYVKLSQIYTIPSIKREEYITLISRCFKMQHLYGQILPDLRQADTDITLIGKFESY